HGSHLRVRGARHAGHRRGRRERRVAAQHRSGGVVAQDRRAEASRRRSVTHWRGIWAVFCGGLVAGAYMTKVPPALPQMRAALDLSLVEATYIVTTFNVLGMLAGMAAGMLGDRYGRRRLALGGLALLAGGGAM